MIHIEHPPSNVSPELSAYLVRMFSTIDNALSGAKIIPPQSVLPTKVQDGMLCNFAVAITPDIPSPGLYINLNKAWVKLNT